MNKSSCTQKALPGPDTTTAPSWLKGQWAPVIARYALFAAEVVWSELRKNGLC